VKDKTAAQNAAHSLTRRHSACFAARSVKPSRAGPGRSQPSAKRAASSCTRAF